MPHSDKPLCPTCGSQLPGEALGGMCPRCLLGVAETKSANTPQGSPRNAPSLEELAVHFPDWEILELLGQGGMGTVYKIRQPRLDRIVAMKVLSCDSEMHDSFSIRFEQEAQLLARIEHPNIVALHHFGEIEDGPNGLPLFYFLMEYVDGTNLETRIRSGAIPVEESLAIVAQVCEALSFAHEQGVIHRDIKPANLLLDSRGTVKVADFGIAKILSDDENPLVSGVTLTGSSMGTPFYMAPEALDHPDTVDGRADVYSVGVILHQLLTGERPAGLMSLPSSTGLPKFLDKPVAQAVERDPEKRVASAGALNKLIERAATQYAKSQRRLSFLPGVFVAASVLTLMIFLSFLPWQDQEPEASIPDSGNETLQTSEGLPIPDSPSQQNALAEPGRLVAIHSSPHEDEIDLSRAEPFSDFVQVYQPNRGWIALRANGDTVSSSGHADRSGIARISPGIYECFSLIDQEGRPELLSDTGLKQGLQNGMPPEVSEIGVEEIFIDRYRALALLRDGTVKAWGEAYDQAEMIPDWMKARGQWKRPPEEALRDVISIGMGLSWDGTITADGRLWIWGKNGLKKIESADPYQGRFRRLSLCASDNADVQLEDGQVLNIFRSMKGIRVQGSQDSPTPLFHSTKYRLYQTPDGRWHFPDETAVHRKFLDQITGWPIESVSLRLSPWNPDSKFPDAIGRMILIAPEESG